MVTYLITMRSDQSESETDLFERRWYKYIGNKLLWFLLRFRIILMIVFIFEKIYIFLLFGTLITIGK